MMIWIALIIGTLVACSLLWLRKKSQAFVDQYRHLDSSGVGGFLDMLLKRGHSGAFLIVEDMDSERFIQFRKYITTKVMGIECHFPDAPWSRDYYSDVVRMVQEQELDFEELQSNDRPTHGFVRIDFGSDISKATKFVQDIFTKIFQCDAVNTRVRSSGISPRDEAIGPKFPMRVGGKN